MTDNPYIVQTKGGGGGSDEEISRIITKFYARQAAYVGRNTLLDIRKNLFDGIHWQKGQEEKDDTEFELVVNYIRNIVLRFTSIMSRHPKPRVPISAPIEKGMGGGDGGGEQGGSATGGDNRRESYLLALWPELMRAWGDVEMNASKLSYGVLQVLWSPHHDQPKSVDLGVGGEKVPTKQYTTNPFKFRSIPTHRFFPVYRTYDHPNDFLEVFRWDPGRPVKDLEQRYGIELQSTGTNEQGDWVLGTEEVCDVVEYWTEENYLLLALTIQIVDGRKRAGAGSRPPRRGDYDRVVRYVVLEDGDNPYGAIPFWVLQNIRVDPDRDPTRDGSMADLDDISGLTTHMEEIMSEEAEEIITNIHRPIVYSSAEHEQDPSAIALKSGAVIPIGEEEELETMRWEGEPTMVPNHVDRIQSMIKDLSFLGDAGFGNIASGMSGVSFHIALTPLQQITELKLPLRKDVLKDVCKFLLQCFERKAGEVAFTGWISSRAGGGNAKEFAIKKEDIGGKYYVEIDYGPLLPRDDAAHVQNEVYKYKTGTQSLLTTLDALGMANPRAEVDRLKAEMEDPVLNPEKVLAITQAKQASQATQQPPPQQGGGMPSPIQGGQGGAGGAGMMGGQGQPGGGMPIPGMMQQMQGGGGAMPGMGAGTAQPGTAGVNPMTMGGMGGVPGLGGPGAPPTPLGGPEEGAGAGINTPFLGRGR